MIFKEKILLHPFTHGGSFKLTSFNIVNSFTECLYPGFWRVGHATGGTVVIWVNVSAYDGNAKDSILQQAQVGFALIEGQLSQGGDGNIQIQGSRQIE